MITTKVELKSMFHQAKEGVEIDKTGTGKELDKIIVEVYQYMQTKYDKFTKDDAKQIALCLVYDYGFLYR